MVNFDEYLMMLPPGIQQQVGSFYSGTGSVQRANAMRGNGGFGGGGGFGGPQYYGGMASGSNPYANINPYRYSYMDAKESPGDRLLADLIRAQTQDYQTRFAPIENMLASSITRTGTTFLEGDLERTRGAVMGASQNVQGMADRSAERLGINRTQMDPNSTTSTLVGGLNETRMRDSDRRLQLLTGGLSGITQNVRNIG